MPRATECPLTRPFVRCNAGATHHAEYQWNDGELRQESPWHGGGRPVSLDYRVLGPIEVWAHGRKLDIGGARQRRLVAALVLAAGRPLSADRLIGIVWSDDPPDQARNTLRTYIARARRALEVDGAAPLLTDPNGWLLERPADALDSERFESLLATGRAMSADPRAALSSIEEALSLWRDDAFVEFRDEQWCAGEAVRLDGLRLAAEEQRFEAMLGCGLHDDAIGELERFTERHPLRDRSQGQLMLALYRAGRQVDAVRRYHDYRRYLNEEIGVDPSDELRTLEQRIIVRDPSLQQLPSDGRQLRGYQLGPAIGQGAFGRVYRAAQPILGREVAIKVVRPELADDPAFIRRFDGEARVVARLEHPHIVPLFDYWREPGRAYLVMRYLRGGSAQQLLASRGPLPIEVVAGIADEVGSALASAHAAGVVHRDVKPANILFDEAGSAYLGDFGIAVTSTEPVTGMLPDGVAYASPELARGGEATARSDVYAFGAVLFELLSGHCPFPVDTPLPEMVERKQRGLPTALTTVRPDLPAALDEVFARALDPEPDRRFPSVVEFVVALHSAAPVGAGPRRALAGVARNPYKGLAAFDEADARDLFGRDHLVDELDRAIARSRFVVVVGPSGSGKSSVVRAGLAPVLRGRGAYVVTMVPGTQPMEELSRVLLQVSPAAAAESMRTALLAGDDGLSRAVRQGIPDPDGELTLIVDQFEELFTVSDAADRERFLGAIAAAASDADSRCRVIATIRADFYDRPLSDHMIGTLVQRHTVAVTPLRPLELERAIVEPAAAVGVTIEPALVTALMADAARSPAALPLVQYELTNLFDGKEGDRVTLAAYERHGGLGGAIARRADEIWDGLDETERDHVRRLFGRLVAPGDRGDDTRRQVRVSELAGIPVELVDAYTKARLLTVDRDPSTREPTIAIAHEALIREWPRLQRWVDADREGLRTLGHLTAAAADWEASRQDPGELFRGGRLVAAEEWVAAHPGELTPTEQAFVDASVTVRDAEQARDRRRVRRLRALVGSLAVVAVAAVGAGLVAIQQRRIADDNAAQADRRALENRAAQLVSDSALARTGGDPDLAILLALAAHDVSDDISDRPQPGVVAALHEAVHASRLERLIPGGFTEIAVSPDGRTVALDHLPEKNRLATYDIGTGALLAERTFDDHVGGLSFRPDGSLLAVSFCCTDQRRDDELPAMLLLDPASLTTVHELDGGVHSWRPSWSADGGRVLSNGFAGVRLWRVGSAEVELAIPGTDEFSAAAFLPEHDTIAVASAGRLDVVELDSGETLASHPVPPEVVDMQASPSGDRLAYIDRAADTAVVIDVESGATAATVRFPSPESIAFSPNGASLSIGGNIDVVRVVDIESGDTLELHGHGTGVVRQVFAAGGRLLVPMREGGTRVWDTSATGPPRLGNLDTEGQLRGGQAPTDTELLVSVQTGPGEGHVTAFDLASGVSRQVAGFWFGDFRWPVLSSDGALAAGFSRDDRIPTVIDIDTGDLVATLGPCDAPQAIDHVNGWVLVDARCPDPSASPSANAGRTGFVDLATDELIDVPESPRQVFEGVVGPPGSVAADVVAYQAFDQRLRVVFRRASTLELLTAWEIPDGMITLASTFSPDGARLGISAQSREAIVFDVEAILAGVAADEAVTIYPERHAGPTQRVVPLDDTVFTTGGGAEVRQWDAESGRQLVDLSTEAGVFVHLFALPDGEVVFYADADGVLRRYLTDLESLVELARSSVQRDFTERECARFFPAGNCPTASGSPSAPSAE